MGLRRKISGQNDFEAVHESLAALSPLRISGGVTFPPLEPPRCDFFPVLDSITRLQSGTNRVQWNIDRVGYEVRSLFARNLRQPANADPNLIFHVAGPIMGGYVAVKPEVFAFYIPAADGPTFHT